MNQVGRFVVGQKQRDSLVLYNRATFRIVQQLPSLFTPKERYKQRPHLDNLEWQELYLHLFSLSLVFNISLYDDLTCDGAS